MTNLAENPFQKRVNLDAGTTDEVKDGLREIDMAAGAIGALGVALTRGVRDDAYKTPVLTPILQEQISGGVMLLAQLINYRAERLARALNIDGAELLAIPPSTV